MSGWVMSLVGNVWVEIVHLGDVRVVIRWVMSGWLLSDNRWKDLFHGVCCLVVYKDTVLSIWMGICQTVRVCRLVSVAIPPPWERNFYVPCGTINSKLLVMVSNAPLLGALTTQICIYNCVLYGSDCGHASLLLMYVCINLCASICVSISGNNYRSTLTGEPYLH